MRLRNQILPALTAAGLALGLAGCSEDIDRTQPDKVLKCTFTVGGCDEEGNSPDSTPAEYYFARTVIDVPSTDPATFVGNQSDVSRVIFDITEDTLYVYRAHPWLTADDAGDVNQADDFNYSGDSDYGRGAAIAAFPIRSHFDVIRDYNPATGEQRNVLVENMSDRPWYERKYIRVDWSSNLISSQTWYGMSGLRPVSTAVTPQQDDTHDLGKEATVISEDYVDFVQNWLVEGATLPGSEAYYGFPIPYCWLYSSMHADCAGGVVKVRFSFNRVQESNYVPLRYEDDRMSKFGMFRTERYTTNDEYNLTEQGVVRLANRWNTWNNWDCYDPQAERPFGACSPDDIKPIVYYVNEDMPAHMKEPAALVGDRWNTAFKTAILAATGWGAEALENTDVFVMCLNNPVKAGDPEACGEVGLNPQIGDIRYSFNYYVPEQHASSPLGYGPSHTDFFTGEIFNGNAYFYGAPARWIARRALDIFKYDEGLLDGPDIGDGVQVRDRHPRANGEEIVTQWARLRGGLDLDKVRERFESQDFQNRVADLQLKVQSGEAAIDPLPMKRAALEQSTLNNLFQIEEIKRGLGISVEGEDGQLPAELFTADKLLSDDMFWLYKSKEDIFAAHRTHVMRADEYLEESFLGFDERYVPMFEEIRERFMQGGVLDEDGAMDFIEGRVFIDTQLHEVGHTLGMRHNFAGSADALNFGKQWWELRASAGFLNGGSIVMPEYLIANPAAYDDAIRQGLRTLQSTAVMEYMSTYGTDTTMGEYETNLLKYVYYDTVEIFDRSAPNVDITPERAEQLRPGALHYSFYPMLISDSLNYDDRIEAMYARSNINYRMEEADPEIIRVPYKFCSDEYAGGSAECERWDQGMDNFERVSKRISDYQSYYWFDAFKRERLGWGVSPFDYVSRLYSRTFKGAVDQYKHWVNEELIVRSDQPCIYWVNGQRVEDNARLFGTTNQLSQFACGLPGFAAGSEALNMLANVIMTPDVGCYTRLETGCYLTAPGNTGRGGIGDPSDITRVSLNPSDCDGLTPTGTAAPLAVYGDDPYYHLSDSTICPTDGNGTPLYEITDADTGEIISLDAKEIPLGIGKPSRTRYDRDRYGYHFYWKPTVMGSWWEKWMAVKALYDHNTNFIGVDASADTASYLISLGTLFGTDINNLIGAAVNEKGVRYGPKFDQGGIGASGDLVFPKTMPLFQNDASRDTIVGPSLDPDQEYTFRLIAMMNAAYQSSYVADTFEFAETLYVDRCLSQSCTEIPADLAGDPDRYQQVRDPVTGETWFAVRPDQELQAAQGTAVYAAGFELIKEMKEKYYVGGANGPGEELLDGVQTFQPRGDFRFLNIMSGVHRVFRYGTVWSGDIDL